MRAVVDTNVIAYYLLHSPEHEIETREFWAGLREPLARRLGIHTVPVNSLWHGALLRAIHSGIAVYDTLFIELAERENVSLVTFDKRLHQAWPGIARRPGETHLVG